MRRLWIGMTTLGVLLGLWALWYWNPWEWAWLERDIFTTHQHHERFCAAHRSPGNCRAGDWLQLTSFEDIGWYCSLREPPLILGGMVYCRYLGYRRDSGWAPDPPQTRTRQTPAEIDAAFQRELEKARSQSQ